MNLYPAIEMFAAGKTRQAIAGALGVSASTITRYLLENGVDVRSRRRAATVAFVWDAAGITRVREMVAAGDSGAKIRRVLGVGHLTLLDGCARHGIPIVRRAACGHVVRQPHDIRVRDRRVADAREPLPSGSDVSWGVLRAGAAWLGDYAR